MLFDLAKTITTTPICMCKMIWKLHPSKAPNPLIVKYESRLFTSVFVWMLCKFSSVPESLNKLFLSKTLISDRLATGTHLHMLSDTLGGSGAAVTHSFYQTHPNGAAALHHE